MESTTLASLPTQWPVGDVPTRKNRPCMRSPRQRPPTRKPRLWIPQRLLQQLVVLVLLTACPAVGHGRRWCWCVLVATGE